MKLFVIVEESSNVVEPHAVETAYSNQATAIQAALQRALSFVIDHKKGEPELDLTLEQASDGMAIEVNEPNGNVWLSLTIDEVVVSHAEPEE